ncbi:MAG: hypothetical protein V1744_07300 [Candidatus Altiarchaeota archaeon]
MWKYVVALGVVLVVVFVAYNMRVAELPKESNLSTAASYNATNVSSVVVACIIDLDCGLSGETDYVCWKDFVAKDHINYTCVDRGLPNATCVGSLVREVFEWCMPDEVCVPGKSVCNPGPSCTDGVRNQNESGVDCGGPCQLCVSCNNGLRDGDEVGVDCGGSCPACVIQCTTNASCGIPRWGSGYCREGSVYQDYVTFECRNHGRYSSFCTQHVMSRVSDYCGPTNPCIEGVCYDSRYKGALKMPSYVCDDGELCSTDGAVYLTCKGSLCFDVKALYGEVDKGPGARSD